MRYEVTNDLFAEKSWYFRNALVRANYSNRQLDVEKTSLPLEEFFKVLVFQEEIELKNRYLRIGADHGSSVAKATAGLHRKNVGVNVGVKQLDDVINVVINDVIKLTRAEADTKALIEGDSHISAARIAEKIGLKQRQVQRIIAALKKKAGLKRRGARKNGEWYFEEP